MSDVLFVVTFLSGAALGFLFGWFRAWSVAIGVVKARLGVDVQGGE